MKQKLDINLMDSELFEKALERVEAFVKNPAKSEGSKRVLVVGDVGLDKYLYGDVHRISPEAPVPVVNLEKEEVKLGLSANVAKNIASLGGDCDLLGLVGSDQAAGEVQALLGRIKGVEPKLVVSSTRPTTEKTRVLSGQHHLLRLDSENSSELGKEEKTKFLEAVESLDFSKYSHVILEDYGKGVLFKELCRSLIQKAHTKQVRVLVDPSKKADLKKFKGSDFFKPNYNETLSYSDKAGAQSYSDLLSWILKEGEFGTLISTLGAKGMSLATKDKSIRIPTFARNVFDVTGAGDTVIAALAFSLSRGLSVEEACVFANFAAGFVVSKIGAISCSMEDVALQMEKTPKEEILRRFG